MSCPPDPEDEGGATQEVGCHRAEGPGLGGQPAEFSPSFVAQLQHDHGKGLCDLFNCSFRTCKMGLITVLSNEVIVRVSELMLADCRMSTWHRVRHEEVCHTLLQLVYACTHTWHMSLTTL